MWKTLLVLVLLAAPSAMIGCGGSEPVGDDPMAKGEPVMDNVPEPAP